MCPSENEWELEDKDYDDNKVSANEIDSWNNFEYALREEKQTAL